jgi:transcription antitermination factor NusG
LFPGYLFFRGLRSDRRVVLESNLLARAIEVLDQARLGEELTQIHRLQQSGATFVPRAYLARGDEVRVTEGPFQGYKGVVVHERGATRLVVSVSLLRKAVAVEFERAVLAPVGPRRLSNSADRAIA